MKVKVKSLSCVRLFVIPWTVAYQASLSMGFSRQEYRSGLPFPSPGDIPNPGIEPRSPWPGKPKVIGYSNQYLPCSKLKLRKFYFLFIFLATPHAGFQFPNQGSNPCPLQWKGRPGNSPNWENFKAQEYTKTHSISHWGDDIVTDPVASGKSHHAFSHKAHVR